MVASIKLCLLGLSGHFSCLVIKGGGSPSNLALSESYTGTIIGSVRKISWIPLLLVALFLFVHIGFMAFISSEAQLASLT